MGFVAGHLPLRVATPWPPKLMPEHYADPVPVLEEVTERSLTLDVRAAEMRLNVSEGRSGDGKNEHIRGSVVGLSVESIRPVQEEGSEGLPKQKRARHCPVPEELKKYGVWSGCGEFAYATHPKGFRSEPCCELGRPDPDAPCAEGLSNGSRTDLPHIIFLRSRSSFGFNTNLWLSRNFRRVPADQVSL